MPVVAVPIYIFSLHRPGYLSHATGAVSARFALVHIQSDFILACHWAFTYADDEALLRVEILGAWIMMFLLNFALQEAFRVWAKRKKSVIVSDIWAPR